MGTIAEREDPMNTLASDETVLDAFAEVVAACGTSEFYAALLAAVGKIIPFDTCGVIQFSKFTVPQYILTRDIPDQEMKFYLSGFYRLDPFFQHWRRTGTQGVVSLSRISDTVDASDYRSSFQPRTGMMDEIGIICPKFHGVADDLFFLRSAPFDSSELERLDAVFPLIQQLHALNIRLGVEALPNHHTRPNTAPRTLSGASCFAVLDRDGKAVFTSPSWSKTVANDLTLSESVHRLMQSEQAETLPFSGGYVTQHLFDKSFSLSPEGKLILVFPGEIARAPLALEDVIGALHGSLLTPRERDICRLILKGHPTAGIAGILNISPGTIKNHRKRMYLKLDITSERELFLSVLSIVANR